MRDCSFKLKNFYVVYYQNNIRLNLQVSSPVMLET